MYFEPKDIQALKEALAAPRKIVLITHKNPDGDAMGSSLGWLHLLKKNGHDVTLIIPSAFGHFLSWLPGAGLSVNAGKETPRAIALIKEADFIFCLDFSALNRIENIGEEAIKSQIPIVLIDHHLDPEKFAWLNFHRTGISSTAELVFRLATDLGWEHLVDKAVAECLYTGIMTDTGSFRFPETTADVHRIVATLVETGLEVSKIHNLVYDNYSELRMRFLGHCLVNKLIVLPDYKTAYMAISKAECERFQVREGDTEGIVNLNLSIHGIRFGVFMTEGDSKIKISFRSIGNFRTNEFAAHFNGGGHPNASGGTSTLSLAETEKKFLALLEDYKSDLNNL